MLIKVRNILQDPLSSVGAFQNSLDYINLPLTVFLYFVVCLSISLHMSEYVSCLARLRGGSGVSDSTACGRRAALETPVRPCPEAGRKHRSSPPTKSGANARLQHSDQVWRTNDMGIRAHTQRIQQY